MDFSKDSVAGTTSIRGAVQLTEKTRFDHICFKIDKIDQIRTLVQICRKVWSGFAHNCIKSSNYNTII